MLINRYSSFFLQLSIILNSLQKVKKITKEERNSFKKNDLFHSFGYDWTL